VHIPGGNYTYKRIGFPEGKGDVQLSAIIGFTVGVVSSFLSAKFVVKHKVSYLIFTISTAKRSL
jgi:hypothetical protein